MDRRMLDYVCGLDTEFGEIVNGSHLYFPDTKLDDVATKELVSDTVRTFDTFQLVQRKLGMDRKLAYGRGVVMLFHGTSGTGRGSAVRVWSDQWRPT
eukprot:gene46069-55673_t